MGTTPRAQAELLTPFQVPCIARFPEKPNAIRVSRINQRKNRINRYVAHLQMHSCIHVSFLCEMYSGSGKLRGPQPSASGQPWPMGRYTEDYSAVVTGIPWEGERERNEERGGTRSTVAGCLIFMWPSCYGIL